MGEFWEVWQLFCEAHVLLPTQIKNKFTEKGNNCSSIWKPSVWIIFLERNKSISSPGKSWKEYDTGQIHLCSPWCLMSCWGPSTRGTCSCYCQLPAACRPWPPRGAPQAHWFEIWDPQVTETSRSIWHGFLSGPLLARWWGGCSWCAGLWMSSHFLDLCKGDARKRFKVTTEDWNYALNAVIILCKNLEMHLHITGF